MPLGIQATKSYPTDPTVAHWRGLVVTQTQEFDLFLKGPVRDRVTDAHFEAELSGDLQALATTDMASETLNSLLESVPLPLDWEIGEAMAECLLQQEHAAVWPWNENRDRKTPKASLPGADLIGFIGEGSDTSLLIGEVKTSSDKTAPPGVMNGRGGMIHQLDTLAASTGIHFSLLKWLAARCKNTPLWSKFQSAVTRYLQSGGKDVFYVGVLLRDTSCDPDDLRARGEKAAAKYPHLPRMRLDAWYLPRPIDQWVQLTMEDA